MARYSIPTTARLPSTLRISASNPAALKSLNRLSREALISLALDWLDERTLPNAVPYLEREDYDEDDDPDDLYPPARSLLELQELWKELQHRKGSKRDVASRIVEGDWRHGLTLYQLAMADFAYLDEHPSSQKWSAYQILALEQLPPGAEEDEKPKVDKESLTVPRFHPSTFVQNLQQHVLPDVKAHYHFHRPKDFPVLLLRVFVIDSPYNSNLALSSLDGNGTTASFDSSRSVYLAFPDGSTSLYISRPQNTGAINGGESKSLRSLIAKGVPSALSRPKQRFTLRATNFTSRNLEALLAAKGADRGQSSGGGWSIYADDTNKISPVDIVLPTPPLSRESSHSSSELKRKLGIPRAEQESKRAKLVAAARFGSSGIVSDGKGIEKLEVILQDPFPRAAAPVDLQDEDEGSGSPSRDAKATGRRSTIDATLRQVGPEEDIDDLPTTIKSLWTPDVKLTFRGTHVFAGIRQLVEAGIVDGGRMPGWMTGDECVTIGAVRQGRIRNNKASGP